MDRRYSELLRAIAAFRRYVHAERAKFWEEGFAFGVADVDQVFATVVCGEPLFMPRCRSLREQYPAREYRSLGMESGLAEDGNLAPL